MRQVPQNFRKQVNTVFQPLFFVLIVGVLVASGLIFYAGRPQKEANLPAIQEVVRAKAMAAAEFNAYGLVVEERGPGYSLRFDGQIKEGLVHGKLESYDLEIYSDQKQFFVKGTEALPEWEKMEKAELNTLSFLVRDPFALLAVLLSDKQIVAVEGPRRMVGEIECQTYFLEIPPPDLQLLTGFAEEAILDKLELYLWFAEENLFMHRMALLLSITVKGEQIQIYRIYNLNPQVREMPEGLPAIDKITANPLSLQISRRNVVLGEMNLAKQK